MANHTQIRLVQVTGSVVDFKPDAIATGVAAAAFGANDLSGSLQYFAQALSNIHGSTEFGGQTRGLIEAPDGSDYDLKFHQLDAGQSIHLDSDGTVTDAIDIDSAGGMDVDVAGILDIDAGDDSVIAVTTAAKDLTVAASGGGAQVLALNSAGTGTNALDINASAGGIDIDAAAAIDILAATTMTIKGAGVSKYGDDIATWDFDGAGAVSETGMTSLSATPSAAITLTAGAASTWSTSAGALTIDSAAAATWGTSAGVLTIDGAAGLTLDSDGTDAVNLGTEAAAKTITIGNAASTMVDINALALDFDSAAATDILAATTLSAKGATGATFGDDTEALAFDGSGNVDFDAVALDIDASGAITIDGTSTLSVNAADDSDITVSTAAKDLALSVSGGGAQVLQLNSAGTGADAIDINASAGGIDIDATTSVAVNATTTLVLQGNNSATFGDDTEALAFDGSGNVDFDAVALDIDASGAITMDSTSTIVISGDASASFGDDTEALAYDGSGNVDFDAVALDIDASGAITIDGTSTLSVNAADDSDITVSTAAKDLALTVSGGGAQVLQLNSAGTGADAIDINATAGGLDVDVAGAVAVLSGLDTTILTADDKSLTLGEGINAASDTMIRLVHDSGTVTNEKILIQNAAGTTGDAIKLYGKAGGIWIDTDSAAGDAINIDSSGGVEIDAAGIIGIESSAGDIKVGTDNVNRGISVGTAGTRIITVGSTTAFSSVVGQALIMSGTQVVGISGSVSLSTDGSMTSGEAGGMAFGGYDEFATFRNKSIFSASTTVVGALNTLATNITGATATIFTGSLAADVAPNGAVTVTKQVGDNGTLQTDVGDTKAMVYVNGQLLVSSSIGGTNDYFISATDTLKFQFAMKTGDLVQVIDRS